MGCRLLLLALLLALFTSGCKPCERLVNGICYDQPNSENPGLTARWEMIDLETGKPIPDVWISFFWRSFADTKSRGACARNVIGRTDANGEFSNLAQDGSWLIDGILMYKPGYYPARYEKYLDQTHITDFHELLFAPKGTYQDWETKLTASGYTVDSERKNLTYRKDFELGTEYRRIFDDIWSPKGLRIYWLKQRTFPPNFQSLYAGQKCWLPHSGGEANIDSVGYTDPKNTQEYMRRWTGIDAYQMLCENNWDTVPKEFNNALESGFALEAIAAMGESEYSKREAVYARYFDPKTLGRETDSRILPEQRRRFCADVQPYTRSGVSNGL